MSSRAYTRLPVDERRRLLLERATELFATHGYDELTMARIARGAGISKPLLYHYFRSKRALFEAVLQQAAEEHVARIGSPLDPNRPPVEQLAAGLDAYLRWIDEHATTYASLMRSVGLPEVRDLVDRVRDETAARILAGLVPDAPPPPSVRTAVRGWLWSIDGVCTDWVAERDLTREEVHGLLLGTLAGALTAAGLDLASLAA
jgi:AcrR family transcriptional regulator